MMPSSTHDRQRMECAFSFAMSASHHAASPSRNASRSVIEIVPRTPDVAQCHLLIMRCRSGRHDIAQHRTGFDGCQLRRIAKQDDDGIGTNGIEELTQRVRSTTGCFIYTTTLGRQMRNQCRDRTYFRAADNLASRCNVCACACGDVVEQRQERRRWHEVSLCF